MKGTVIVLAASAVAGLIASMETPNPVEAPKTVQAPKAETAPGPAKELDNYFSSLVTENKLSGVLLVAQNGVTIASKAAGIANKATNAPIDLNTKFNLGSANKMFTAVAIAQLAQAGKLSFDDRVGKHLPDYPNKEVAEKVTIHHLLTHTSGMGSYWGEKFAREREKLLTVADNLRLFASDALSFPPGEKFQYSNAGFMLLGAIIEKVSGQDYYSYVRDHIFKPAGMNDTGFYEPGREIPNLAIGYTRMGPNNQPLAEVRDNEGLREIRGGPAGGGYSTAPDLVKFHQALRSFKLLSDESTKLVTTGKVEAGGPIGRYGYGFSDKMFNGKHIVGHNGGSPGVAANFEMYPELGYTAVLLMNSDPPTMMPVIMGVRERIPAR